MGLLILLAFSTVLICLLGSAILAYSLLRPPRKTLAVALARGIPTHPADVASHAESITLSLADGSDTPAWIMEGRNSCGPTVVVIHGFADSRYGALTWTPLIAPHARRLLLFDQRGHGESEARISHLGTKEPDDVLAILDQIDLTPEEGGAVLFGYSMGAGIAIAAAAAAPERIGGVIADGPYRFWNEPVRPMLRSKRCPVQPFLGLAAVALQLTLKGLDRFDRVESAAQLSCPLCVLHGTDDPLCPLASARAIAEAAPRGRLVAFEGGGHLDLASVDPARYRESLTEFFASLRENPVATL